MSAPSVNSRARGRPANGSGTTERLASPRYTNAMPMTPNTTMDCSNRTGTSLPTRAVESCGSALPRSTETKP